MKIDVIIPIFELIFQRFDELLIHVSSNFQHSLKFQFLKFPESFSSSIAYGFLMKTGSLVTKTNSYFARFRGEIMLEKVVENRNSMISEGKNGNSTNF